MRYTYIHATKVHLWRYNYEIALIGAHNQSERLIPDGHMKKKLRHQKQQTNNNNCTSKCIQVTRTKWYGFLDDKQEEREEIARNTYST